MGLRIIRERFNDAVEHLVPLIVLNFLWLIASVPVITCGAAWAALYSACRDVQGGLRRGYVQAYWAAFKRCLGRSLPISLVMILLPLEVAFVLRRAGVVAVLTNPLYMILMTLICVAYFFMFTWVYPLMDQGKRESVHIVRDVLLLSFSKPGKTLSCLGTSLFMILLTCLCPLLLLAVISTPAYLHSRILESILRSYRQEGVMGVIAKK